MTYPLTAFHIDSAKLMLVDHIEKGDVIDILCSFQTLVDQTLHY